MSCKKKVKDVERDTPILSGRLANDLSFRRRRRHLLELLRRSPKELRERNRNRRKREDEET